jgi:SusD/RagB-like outer membrane lipoprotein
MNLKHRQMKKIQYKLIAIGFLVLFLVVGCTKDFEKTNISPNDPTEVPTAYLLTSAQKVMISFVWDEWWNGRLGNLYPQYWAQNSYTDEARYKYRDGVNNNYWVYFYAGRDVTPDGTLNGGGMEDLERIILLNTDEETKVVMSQYGANVNQIAVAKILKVWMYQIITDTWGDVPYAEALQGETINKPVYSKQQDIYADLLVQLTDAAAMIDANEMGVAGDMIYGGDMSMWKKFANSLKLRVAIRMSGVDAAKATSSIQSAMGSIFESNADNAVFNYLTGTPNNNPLNENQKIRSDFSVAKPLMDIMIDRTDPRIPFVARPSNNADAYVGLPYGLTADEATALDPGDFSFPGDCVYAPTAPSFFMNYDEVCFIMAEAEALLSVGSAHSAQEWYEMGIRASMERWNGFLTLDNLGGFYRLDISSTERSIPEAIISSQVDDYLANPMVAWDAANAQKLILEQKYIAMYPQGLQSWFEWIRTGYPDNLAVPGTDFSPLVAGLTHIPYRMVYPSLEQTLNGENYNNAVEAQGPDNFDTKPWWAK